MKTCLVTIEAEFNDRIQAGLSALESLWTSDHGLAVRPGGRWCYKSKDYIQATLEVDFGRYDAEGDNYICNLFQLGLEELHLVKTLGWNHPEVIAAQARFKKAYLDVRALKKAYES